MPRISDIEQIGSAKVRRLHAWWLAKRGARPLPDRSDLEPAELRSLLPNLLIAECESNPFRIRYRLIGTVVVEVSGFDFTGRYLDELIAPDLDEPWLEHYRICRDTQRPVFGTVTVPTTLGTNFTYEFGIFPMTKSGTEVAQFLAIEDYGDSSPRLQELIEDIAHWEARRQHEGRGQ
jgi:hypothetical protein